MKNRALDELFALVHPTFFFFFSSVHQHKSYAPKPSHPAFFPITPQWILIFFKPWCFIFVSSIIDRIVRHSSQWWRCWCPRSPLWRIFFTVPWMQTCPRCNRIVSLPSGTILKNLMRRRWCRTIQLNVTNRWWWGGSFFFFLLTLSVLVRCFHKKVQIFFFPPFLICGRRSYGLSPILLEVIQFCLFFFKFCQIPF